AVADRGAGPLHLLGDDRRGRPGLGEAGDVAQEPRQDLRPVGSVDDLRMELDAVQRTLRALASGDRRARAGGEGGEARRRLEDAVAVAHPALLLSRKSAEEPTAPVGELEWCAAELARLGALDATTEDANHRLHPVADAQHGGAQLGQLAPKLRRALGVHGGWSPR